jgi:hypothetical protein
MQELALSCIRARRQTPRFGANSEAGASLTHVMGWDGWDLAFSGGFTPGRQGSGRGSRNCGGWVT